MLHVAVDAFNLSIDRRGMGRYARAVLETLSTSDDLAVSLIVRRRADFENVTAAENHNLACATLGQARRTGFDVTWYPWNGMRFALDGPSVATIHDAFAFGYPHPNPVARWREQAPIRRAVQRASVLTTVSQFSAGRIAEQFGFESGALTIASPVPEPFWRPVPSRPSPTYMLFIAGPEARKNAAVLFCAFAAAFPDGRVQLRIAGRLSPSDERELRRLGIFHARLFPDDSQLRDLYAGAIAVLVPSREEGYGLPAVEAMACGAPVIAADSGGLPEACDGAALLIDPDSVVAWEAALRLLADDAELRKRLAQRSLARAARIDRAAPGRVIAECLRRAAAVAR